MTLIEVMAVVFIIGLTGTLVLLTVPNRQLPERTLVQSLQDQLQMVLEEAVLVGAPRGLDVEANGTITAYAYRRAEWLPVRSIMPTSDDLEIIIREHPRAANRSRQTGRAPTDVAPVAPRFVAEPIGVSSGIELEIIGEQERYFLSVGEDGVVDVSER